MKLRVYGIMTFSILALTAITGCDRGTQTQRTDTAQNQGEEVISRNVEPGQTELSENAVKRDETQVEAQREVITRETETLNESVPTVVSGREKLDVNQMKSEDFVALGLNQQVADRVIQHREQNGPFKSIEDLSSVSGIDQTWLNRYRDRFAFLADGQNQNQAGQAEMQNQ